MGERWDRDRLMYEASREQNRYEDDNYSRGGRDRDHSDERYDRRFSRGYDDNFPPRDRPRFHDDEPRWMPRREPPRESREFDRREFEPRRPPPPVMEREREREPPWLRDSPPRPGLVRRQSSLDTYDRRPLRNLYDPEELPPPARREDIRRDDYRAPAYTPIPLPKSRGLPPPPRRSGERFSNYEEIRVAEPDFYGDEEYRPYPERVHERQMVRERRRRNRSRESHATRTHSHRSSSRSSSVSSRSSSSTSAGGTTIRSGSEYPKKGKTRVPAKLVSLRALAEIGYPYHEEGNTIIIEKALGQHNIDELLRMSEDYKHSDMELAKNRSLAGNFLEDRREYFVAPAPPPPAPASPAHHPPRAPASVAPPPAAPTVVPTPAPPPAMPAHPPAPAPAPMVPPPPMAHMPYTPAPPPPMAHYTPGPPPPMAHYTPGPPPPVIYDAAPPAPPVSEYYERQYVRESSPAPSSSYDTYYQSSHHHHHHEAGPLTVVSRSRSRSRNRKDIRAEIKALERELTHRPKGSTGERELVRAERLPDGQLILYEEKVEKVVEAHKPPRIEKDKKGPPPKLMRAMLSTLT